MAETAVCSDRRPEEIGTKGSASVLLVGQSRPFLSRLFQSCKATADHAAGVNEALRRSFDRSYDAVLTDEFLPDGSWRAVLQNTLRGNPMAAVFISAGLCPSVALWCEVREKGGAGLLVEPYDSQQVCALIDRAVHRKFVPLS